MLSGKKPLLSQWWPRFITSYSVTSPKWVNESVGAFVYNKHIFRAWINKYTPQYSVQCNYSCMSCCRRIAVYQITETERPSCKKNIITNDKMSVLYVKHLSGWYMKSLLTGKKNTMVKKTTFGSVSSNVNIWISNNPSMTSLSKCLVLTISQHLPGIPFYWYGLTLIPAWISNYFHYKMWDGITFPFLNFNGATVEV